MEGLPELKWREALTLLLNWFLAHELARLVRAILMA